MLNGAKQGKFLSVSMLTSLSERRSAGPLVSDDLCTKASIKPLQRATTVFGPEKYTFFWDSRVLLFSM